MSEGPKHHHMKAQPGGIDISGSDALLRKSQPLRLGRWELFFAGLAAVGALLGGLGTFGAFVVDAGQAAGWWGGP